MLFLSIRMFALVGNTLGGEGKTGNSRVVHPSDLRVPFLDRTHISTPWKLCWATRRNYQNKLRSATEARPYKLNTVQLCGMYSVDTPILHPLWCHCKMVTIYHHSQQWEDLPCHNLPAELLQCCQLLSTRHRVEWNTHMWSCQSRWSNKLSEPWLQHDGRCVRPSRCWHIHCGTAGSSICCNKTVFEVALGAKPGNHILYTKHLNTFSGATIGD